MKTDRGRIDAPGDDERGGEPVRGDRRVKDAPRNQEWLLALLPAFPLVLLVMRLWYASRQDTQTLLLLVQTISPLGMLSAVLLTTVWVLPALVLGGRLLGTLYWVSTGRSSWLVRAAERLPGWVVLLALVVGLCAWQLRFLPTLAMMALAVAGLTVRDRFPGHEELRATVCYALPVIVAVLSYALLWPAITAAFAARDVATAILLTLPPGLTVLLTGPVPEAPARVLTHGIAIAMSVLTPFLVGVVVMKAPILPMIALQFGDGGSREVIVGYLVASDDQMSTVLGREGTVRFIPNDRLQSKVLCPDPGDVPRTWVNLHGWYVEQSVLSWLVPAGQPGPADPRCQGRVVDDPTLG
ncbi:hypothetical protein GCM10010517_12800 [Streptosporangium fragile]|uniref:Uncharacterized protein n=1 Tax=Streptosporangium fragile TaxID=46186 RepID=A0ABN3VSG6_9ACTN